MIIKCPVGSKQITAVLENIKDMRPLSAFYLNDERIDEGISCTFPFNSGDELGVEALPVNRKDEWSLVCFVYVDGIEVHSDKAILEPGKSYSATFTLIEKELR